MSFQLVRVRASAAGGNNSEGNEAEIRLKYLVVAALCAQRPFSRRVGAGCVGPLCISAKRVTKGIFMFLRNTGRKSSVSNDEGQAASAGQPRANVLRLPGPCQRWDERDADFIREILDLVGDKWSMLVIGALAGGDARYSDL